jgi:hypothetical protein
MHQERLETIVSAKITDFDAKMGKVLGTLDSVEKKSGTASKKIDSVLESKSVGTSKAVDIVNDKLKQTEQTANRVSKAMAGVDPKKFEVAQAKVARVNAQLDAQARKLEVLNSKYLAYMSREKTPASMRTMEKEFAAVAQEITNIDIAVADLNRRKQELQLKQTMSAGVGDTAGAASYQMQIQALEREEQKLLASTDLLGQKASALNEKMAAIRMNPSLSAEAQALADKIAGADARMEALSHSASAARIELDSMTGTTPGLEAVNQKLGKIERSTSKTSQALNRLNRRFLMLLASKVFRAVFKSLQEGFEGAAKKSEQFKRSLDAVASGGRNISNSIVAAFSPLINTIAPWVTLVAEKIRILLNRVSMFFAAIAGQKTVLQATQALDEFGNAATENAAKAQNALAGFDQITKLDTSAGSGGAGSGSKAAEAFEEVGVIETPFSKAIKGILDKIEELKGPLDDFYEEYIAPIFDWAFEGGGIEGFLDKLKEAIEWFNKNPWAVGVVASLTGLFLAAKTVGTIAGAFNLLGGAGGAGALGAMKVTGMTVLGAATFIGTIYGLDQIFGTDTFGSIQKINKEYGGLLGAIRYLITGETTHIDPITGEEYTKPSKTGKIGAVETVELYVEKVVNPLLDMTLGHWVFDKLDEIRRPEGWTRPTTPSASSTMTEAEKRAEWDRLTGRTQPSPETEEIKEKWSRLTGWMFGNNDDLEKDTLELTQTYSANYTDSMNKIESVTGGTYKSISKGSTGLARKLEDVFGGAGGSMKGSMGSASTSTVQSFRTTESQGIATARNLSALWRGTSGVIRSSAGESSTAWIRESQSMENQGVDTSRNLSNLWRGTSGVIKSSAGESSVVWMRESQTMEQIVSTSLSRIQDRYGMLRSFIDQVMGNITTTLIGGSQTGTQTMGNNFRNMVNRITEYLQRMMINAQTAVSSSFSTFSAMPTSLRNILHISLGSFRMPAIPTLPRFATGGVFDSPTAGIIAEAGREAVLPLDRNTGWMDRLANKIDQGGGGDIYVTVQNVYDGEVVSEKTTRVQRRTSRIHNRPVLA